MRDFDSEEMKDFEPEEKPIFVLVERRLRFCSAADWNNLEKTCCFGVEIPDSDSDLRKTRPGL